MHEQSTRAVRVPRILLVGTHRGVGTSTVALGLTVALRRKSIGIGTAKIGCSLAETTHHRRVMSRLSYSLDPWMLASDQFLESLIRLSGGTEIALFEGSEGLYDVLGEDCTFPTQADMARALGTPIVLVVDARGFGESIAALCYGFSQYDTQIPIAGIIANRVKDAEHAERVRGAIESLNGPRFLGSVQVGDPHQTGGTLVGLHMYNPSALTRNRVIGTGNLVEAGVDLDALREIANGASELPIDFDIPLAANRACKIAVADDQAFHLTVQDNLDLIRRAGGELVAFSPIADRKIPSGASAVYLPGGYTQLYAADLAGNKAMLHALREFVAGGGLVYAEAGALAYLSKKVTLFNGSSFEMVGVIPGVATAIIDDGDPPQVVYQEAAVVEDCMLAPKRARIRGFRDNRWAFRLESPIGNCFALRDRMKTDEEDVTVYDGFSPSINVLATRLNLHWGSRPEVAQWFVRAAAVVAPPQPSK